MKKRISDVKGQFSESKLSALGIGTRKLRRA